jgi:hypothetical protein
VHPIGGDPTTSWPTAVDWGDADGDGDVDVVTTIDGFFISAGAPRGTLTVFVNNGGALTATGQDLPVHGPSDVLLLPLGAADADPEIVVAQRASGSPAVKVFPGAAGASFAAPLDVPAGEGAARMDWGDFDGDQLLDLAVSYGPSSPVVRILPGTAAGPGLGAASDVPFDLWGDAAVGDLDRDGRDDLYVSAPTNAFLHSLGAFAFERVIGPPDELLALSPQIGDMDGDGKLDVVTSGSRNSTSEPDAYFVRYALGPELVSNLAFPVVDFGFVTLGSRAAGQRVEFTNAGPGTASAVQRETAGDVGDYPLEGDTCSGATLAVGQTCALTFGFAPTVAGDREAAFTVFAPDADYVNAVTLFGTGEPPDAAGTPPPSPPPPPPGAAPPPPPPPRSTPARTIGAPVLTVTSLRVLGRRGVRFTQRLPAAGRARWTLEIPAVGRRARVVVGRASRTVTKAGVVRVTIRLTGTGLRQVRRRGVRRLVLRSALRRNSDNRLLNRTSPVRLRR